MILLGPFWATVWTPGAPKMSTSHLLLLPQATPPSSVWPLQAIKSCSTMSELRRLHAHLLKLGLSTSNDAMGRVVKFCTTSENGDFGYALKVFDKMPNPDTFLYNTVMKGFVEKKSPRIAILLYLQMMEDSVAPNHFTFPCLIRACSDDSAVEEGRQVHAHVVKFGFGEAEFSLNNLIHMYVNFQLLHDARKVFDKMPQPNTVSCTTVISGYGRLNLTDIALEVFQSMPEKNSALWNAMIAAYVQNDKFHQALEVFNQMLEENMKLDKFVASTVLSACSGLGALELGKWIHYYIEKAEIEMDSKLVTSIIDMYSKCGCLTEATEFFRGLKGVLVSSWNSMIGGMAIHGRGTAAIELFEEMVKAGVGPDRVTFLNLLTACAHSGLVNEGRRYFHYMKGFYGIDPRTEHYGCMVDLLGRSGLLEEATELIDNMPMSPDSSVLGPLLGACRVHKDVDLGDRVGRRLIEMDPTNSGRYILLSNLYSDSGRWSDATEIRRLMDLRGVRKPPGRSIIEFNGVLNEFTAGERNHPDSELIYAKLGEVIEKIRGIGYVPETEEVFYHSEKLAIAFGLLKMRRGEIIRVSKNLRICRDCHRAAKLISEVFDREIVMRDRKRFHQFRSGECSCNDYW